MSDPLTDALEMMRIDTTLYAIAELAGPWGVGFPATSGAYFHVVSGASCWLTVDEPDEVHRLGDGDVVLLPHGSAHRLTRDEGAAVRTRFDPVTWTPRRLMRSAPDPATRAGRADPGPGEPPTNLGGPGTDQGEPRTELVCGAVHVRQPSSHPVLALLPPVMRVRNGSAGAEELRLTVRVLTGETRRRRPGVDTVLARLGDVLLVQVLRIWAEEGAPGETGWLAALMDPDIGAALATLHADPAAPWTVEQLARTVGLSRSRFAQRFTELVGQPPLTYLAMWRMARGAALLADADITIREVARRVGFSSEPAFSRAFTRHHGLPPSRYRRQRRLTAVQHA